ncbi:LOW QUALITY PROTEIN: cation channel sperm-associated auxiliary subunit gamma [Dromaius novaehollandiae]|uniref:LOW QUALITY PROTEIN: cation channel sperm-associated auxiliary subunit gamma n=1 Tax=Dromaius novaehollandiae TaxID=8790 RepID=UPI00311E0634
MPRRAHHRGRDVIATMMSPLALALAALAVLAGARAGCTWRAALAPSVPGDGRRSVFARQHPETSVAAVFEELTDTAVDMAADNAHYFGFPYYLEIGLGCAVQEPERATRRAHLLGLRPVVTVTFEEPVHPVRQKPERLQIRMRAAPFRPPGPCGSEELCRLRWYTPMPMVNGSAVMGVRVHGDTPGPSVRQRRFSFNVNGYVKETERGLQCTVGSPVRRSGGSRGPRSRPKSRPSRWAAPLPGRPRRAHGAAAAGRATGGRFAPLCCPPAPFSAPSLSPALQIRKLKKLMAVDSPSRPLWATVDKAPVLILGGFSKNKAILLSDSDFEDFIAVEVDIDSCWIGSLTCPWSEFSSTILDAIATESTLFIRQNQLVYYFTGNYSVLHMATPGSTLWTRVLNRVCVGKLNPVPFSHNGSEYVIAIGRGQQKADFFLGTVRDGVVSFSDSIRAEKKTVCEYLECKCPRSLRAPEELRVSPTRETGVLESPGADLQQGQTGTASLRSPGQTFRHPARSSGPSTSPRRTKPFCWWSRRETTLPLTTLSPASTKTRVSPLCTTYPPSGPKVSGVGGRPDPPRAAARASLPLPAATEKSFVMLMGFEEYSDTPMVLRGLSYSPFSTIFYIWGNAILQSYDIKNYLFLSGFPSQSVIKYFIQSYKGEVVCVTEAEEVWFLVEGSSAVQQLYPSSAWSTYANIQLLRGSRDYGVNESSLSFFYNQEGLQQLVYIHDRSGRIVKRKFPIAYILSHRCLYSPRYSSSSSPELRFIGFTNLCPFTVMKFRDLPKPQRFSRLEHYRAEPPVVTDETGFHDNKSLAVYQGLVFHLLWLHSDYNRPYADPVHDPTWRWWKNRKQDADYYLYLASTGSSPGGLYINMEHYTKVYDLRSDNELPEQIYLDKGDAYTFSVTLSVHSTADDSKGKPLARLRGLNQGMAGDVSQKSHRRSCFASRMGPKYTPSLSRSRHPRRGKRRKAWPRAAGSSPPRGPVAGAGRCRLARCLACFAAWEKDFLSRLKLTVVLSHPFNVGFSLQRQNLANWASVLYKVGIQDTALYPQQELSGKNLLKSSMVLKVVNSATNCYQYSESGPALQGYRMVPVYVGCPPGKRMAFDITNTVQYTTSMNKRYFNCLSQNPEMPCFFFKDVFYPLFLIQDMVTGDSGSFSGRYTLKVIGGAPDVEDAIVRYRPEDIWKYNVDNASTESSLIWQKADGGESETDPQGYPIHSSTNNGIKWLCRRNSPCHDVAPVGLTAPNYFFLVAVSNRDVDTSTYCDYSLEFVIHVHGLQLSSTRKLFFMKVTMSVLLGLVTLYFLYCQARRKMMASFFSMVHKLEEASALSAGERCRFRQEGRQLAHPPARAPAPRVPSALPRLHQHQRLLGGGARRGPAPRQLPAQRRQRAGPPGPG